MTLQKAKDQVAKNRGFKDWYELVGLNDHNLFEIFMRLDEAAELYARAKWGEACKEQRRSCYRAYMDQPVVQGVNKHEAISNEMEAIENAPKPEFKP